MPSAFLHPDSAPLALLILLLLAGLGLVILGAGWLVDGSTSIARRLKVSEFVIGLTIVGIGTSTPEMVVSFMGAVRGNADISVGNIVGSNIFNVLLILGVTALIWPMNMTAGNRKRDIPLNIGATLLLILMGMNKEIFGVGHNVLSRADGILFLVLFAVYLFISFRDKPAFPSAPDGDRHMKTPVAVLAIAGGLAALIGGGRLFVDYATGIATRAAVSDKFIAITVLAGGTSMPELATCIVAAAKRKGQLALGDILGSNISNILLILGGSAVICPLSFDGRDPVTGAFKPNATGMDYVDLGVLLLSAIIIWASAYTGHRNRLDRADAVMLLVLEIGYMTWLVFRNAI